MTLRHRVALAALCAAVLTACSDGGDTAPPTPTGPPADAIVTMKETATDLNALDLRDKLLKLPGVEGVIYDQAAKRLRVDFTDAATDAEEAAVIDAARADTAVATAGGEGGAGGASTTDAPAQQPAPGASAS